MKKLDKNTIDMLKESNNFIGKMYMMIAIGIAIPFIIIWLIK
ncbi:hypothetical protein MNB_SUP05-5-730 [hydrothermal vent metagenome]|uniref:Uncharacterized protein n=1 Tax=hydrothermal vent metagenome TaxID=652676 RepID=A0A1W1BVN2_9ZZZZ